MTGPAPAASGRGIAAPESCGPAIELEKKRPLEVGHRQLSPVEADIGRAKQQMFDVGAAPGGVARVCISQEEEEESIPMDIIEDAITLGEDFYIRLRENESDDDVVDLLFSWLQVNPHHQEICTKLSNFFCEYPQLIALFCQELTDYYETPDKMPSPVQDKITANTPACSLLADILLEKIKQVKIDAAYEQFSKLPWGSFKQPNSGSWRP